MTKLPTTWFSISVTGLGLAALLCSHAASPAPVKSKPAAAPLPRKADVVQSVSTNAPVAVAGSSAREQKPDSAAIQKRYMELFELIRDINQDLSFARRALGSDREVRAARQAVLDAQQTYDAVVDRKMRANPRTAALLKTLESSVLEQQAIAGVITKLRESGAITNLPPPPPPVVPPGNSRSIPLSRLP